MLQKQKEEADTRKDYTMLSNKSGRAALLKKNDWNNPSQPATPKATTSLGNLQAKQEAVRMLIQKEEKDEEEKIESKVEAVMRKHKPTIMVMRP